MNKPSTHSQPMAPWLNAFGVWFAVFTLSVVITISCSTSDQPPETDQTSAADQTTEPAAAEVSSVAVATQSDAGGIVTYAGSGSPQFSGDGGPALEAGFYQPTSLELDRNGNVFFSSDHRIRKIDASTGIISTVVGTGRNRSSGDGDLAKEATLAEPVGIALDKSNNMFIVEAGSNLVRKVDSATGIITTVAGGGIGNPREKEFGDGGPASEALIKLPTSVAVDEAGNLYISTDNRVRKVDSATGIITTIAGIGERGLDGDGGPANKAGLAEPADVVVDAQGNVFIADRDNHRVRKVDGSTGIISTVAGMGKFSTRSPALYYVGRSGGAGSINFAPGSGEGYEGDGGPATEAKISVPSAIALGPEDNLFIADGVTRVRKIDMSTGVITTVAASETISSHETGKVLVYTTLIGQIVSIGINDAREIFLADFRNNIIHKVPAP